MTYLLISLFLPFVSNAINCSSIFLDSKNDATLHKIIDSNKFVVDRDISHYRTVLGPTFAFDLKNLNSQSTWVDFGTGLGLAPITFLSEFHNLENAPRVYGTTVKRPSFNDLGHRGPALIEKDRQLQNTGRWISLEGQYLENMYVPVFNLATDFMGPASYTTDLSSVLQIYFDHRKSVESPIYILGGHLDARSTSPKSRTFIITESGEALNLGTWLTTIDDVYVQEGDYGRPMLAETSLRLVGNKKVVIPSLDLIYMKPHSPPTRVFRVKGSNYDLTSSVVFDPRDLRQKNLSELIAEVEAILDFRFSSEILFMP